MKKKKKDVSFSSIDGTLIIKLRGGRSQLAHRDQTKYSRKNKHKGSAGFG